MQNCGHAVGEGREVRVLIITWFYPPWNETASRRPHSWAAFLASQGHSVTVLTPKKDPRLHPNLNAPAPPCDNLTVVETPLRLLRSPVGKGLSWALASIPAARRLARTHDVIISTFMPWYIHVLGRAAKMANPSAPWLADYRDLWHEYDFFTDGRPLKKALIRRFEKWVVKKANMTSTVSPPLAQRLSTTHPHIPSHTIYNGFPAATLRSPWPEARLGERQKRGEPFRILYAGTLYPGYHDPEPVFRALAAKKWSRPIEVHFLGHSARTPLVHQLRDQYNLADVVQTPTEYLSQQECFDLQSNVDLLLHLGWTNSSMDGVLSAKVFEYMAAGTPILSVGAKPESAIGRLLTETGTGTCARLDDKTVEDTLDQLVERSQFPAWYHPNQNAVLGYTREAQAKLLSDLISQGAPSSE